jgi:uncharacterized protein (DUF488 family)
MLIRQKCLLYMVERAGRPVRHLELTKWAFLLARETPSGGGASFYDFVPYRYGPFSFTLFREVGTLVHDGYLSEDEAPKAWRRVTDVSGPGELSDSLRSDAARVVDRFAARPVGHLMDYVYAEFPWYTVNSRKKRLAERPSGQLAVHTVGYEKWSVDRLLDELMRKGISRIIDVRWNPIARRYGFHNTFLSRLASRVGIGYTHFPDLGIPSEARRNLGTAKDYARLFAYYVQGILPSATASVQRVAELVSEKPSVLLCMEADPSLCHRTHLAKAVSEITGLPVQDVRGTPCGLIAN